MFSFTNFLAVTFLLFVIISKLFLFQLPLEELESQYEVEKKKLQEMASGLNLEASIETNESVEKTVTPHELWKAMLPEVVTNVLEIITEGMSL